MIKDLISFLKKPSTTIPKLKGIKSNILYFIKLYIITLIAIKLVDYFILQLFNSGFISLTNKHLIAPIFNLNKNELILYALFSIILTPLLEETIFRLPLTNYKRFFFNISNSLLISSILYYYLIKGLISTSSYFIISILLPYVIIIGVAFLFYFIINKILTIIEKHTSLPRIWDDYFPFIYYVYLFLFASFHLIFNNSKIDFYSFLVLLLPYLIYGVSFSFIRLKQGYFSCLLLHFFFLFPYYVFKIFSI